MVSSVYIRPLLALLVTALITGIATVVIRNGLHAPAPVSPVNQQLPHNIDVTVKKARFSEIQNGLVVWELAAERVDYDKGGDIAYLSAIHMEFPRRQSQAAVTVTADNGESSASAKSVRLTGHVNVVTEDGAHFTTGSIIYSGATDQFTTGDLVTFRQHRLQLTAVGMDLGVKSQKARFHSAVDAAVGVN